MALAPMAATRASLVDATHNAQRTCVHESRHCLVHRKKPHDIHSMRALYYSMERRACAWWARGVAVQGWWQALRRFAHGTAKHFNPRVTTPLARKRPADPPVRPILGANAKIMHTGGHDLEGLAVPDELVILNGEGGRGHCCAIQAAASNHRCGEGRQHQQGQGAATVLVTRREICLHKDGAHWMLRQEARKAGGDAGQLTGFNAPFFFFVFGCDFFSE